MPTCHYAHNQADFAESEETIFCGFNVPASGSSSLRSAACTDYTDRTVPECWKWSRWRS